MSLTKATFSMINGAQVNVLDYGADPTGVADSSAAFQAALLAGATVYVPSGTYKANITIPTTATYGAKRIVGNGKTSTTLVTVDASSPAVITVDATSAYMQHFQLEQIGLQSTAGNVNAIGLYFKGTNVNSINDYHAITDVSITGFGKGVYATGRLIESTWERVFITYCKIGFHGSTDPSNVSFILNRFSTCNFNNSLQEGARVDVLSLDNTFYACNFQGNNSAAVAGVAATHFVDSQNLTFIACYWEDNAGSVAVNTTVPATNSIGCRITGSGITTNPVIINSWMVGSGCILLVDPTVLQSGSVNNCSITPTATGFGVAVTSAVNQGTTQSQFAVNSAVSGQILLNNSVSSSQMGFIQQQEGWFYGANPASVDLAKFKNFMINNSAVDCTLVAPTNLIVGCELTIYAYGQKVTVPGSVMAGGAASDVLTNTMQTFVVLPYPYYGKLAKKA